IPTPEPTPFRNARRMFLTILGDLERGLPRREGDPVPPRVPSSHLEIVRRGSSSHFAASFFFRPSPTTFAWNATALERTSDSISLRLRCFICDRLSPPRSLSSFPAAFTIRR